MTLIITFGTQTIKHLCAHGVSLFASGATDGNETLQNSSFDGPKMRQCVVVFYIFGYRSQIDFTFKWKQFFLIFFFNTCDWSDYNSFTRWIFQSMQFFPVTIKIKFKFNFIQLFTIHLYLAYMAASLLL